MKRILSISMICLVGLLAHSQTLIKLKQLEQTASPSSVIVTVGTPGVPTYTTKLPSSVIPTLSAYVPYQGATASVNLGAQSFSTSGTASLGIAIISSTANTANHPMVVYTNTANTKGAVFTNNSNSLTIIPVTLSGGGAVYNGPWVSTMTDENLHFAGTPGVPQLTFAKAQSGNNPLILNGYTTYTSSAVLRVTQGGLANYVEAEGTQNNLTWYIQKGTNTANQATKGYATVGSTVLTAGQPTFNCIGDASVSVSVTTPSVFGSAASGGTIGIFSTSHATKGLIQIGATTASVNVGGGTFGSSLLHAFRVTRGTGTVDIGEYSAGRGAVWLNQNTPTSSNWCLSADGSNNTFFNGGSSVRLLVGGNILHTINSTNIAFFGGGAGVATSGAITPFLFTTPGNTGQTASTEIPDFKIVGATKTWAAGAITTQRFAYFSANTAAFGSASTISDCYGLYAAASVAGSNCTITRNWGIGTDGLVSALGYSASSTSTLQNVVTQSISCTSYSASGNGTIAGQAVHQAGTILSYTTSSAASLTMLNTITHYSFDGTTSTWTLPAVTGNSGNFMMIKNRGSGNLTINSAAAGNDIYTTTATNTYILASGSALILFNDGTYWNVE